MKVVVLDFESLAPDKLDLSSLDKLQKSYGLHITYFDATAPEQVIERATDAQIILVNKVQLTRATLCKLSKLKYIGVLATGTNNIDMEYCQQNDIQVKNVEGYGTSSVIQHAFTLLLNLSTSLIQYANDVQHGKWQKSRQFCFLDYPINTLEGKTIGILGYGELGQAMASIARTFGMKVIVLNRPGNQTSSATDDVTRVPFYQGLEQLDVLSLHCLLSEQTKEIIDRKVLSAMKPSAFLINTARGGLVNETDLAQALQNKEIAGAGLDVLSTEPPNQDNPLLQISLPNLIITPHTAWGAVEARQKLLHLVVGNLKDWLESRN
ncbi:D-2-hydroxyacid dehydrogenase [Glaciecola sp. 1036]|uniref:D-2-hydroxyacid dehydrogenase n=1 Tax=Alteromonadaceae TaxID=72275 RepID=UPI003D0677E3